MDRFTNPDSAAARAWRRRSQRIREASAKAHSRCADCGELGERTGHMGCMYPRYADRIPMMAFDEQTETTLCRVARGEPITDAAADAAAHVLVERFTDPSNPDNWLKRPAHRVCAHCSRRYVSRISILAAGFYCSPECDAAARARVAELIGSL